MLDIGDSGVGHVYLTGFPMKALTSSTASCDCFIVTDCFVPKEKIIHCTLACSDYSKRLQNQIYDSLWGFDISADYCRIFAWRKNRFRWNDYLNWLETSRVQGNILSYQRTKRVNDGTSCNWVWRIGITEDLGSSSREIKDRISFVSINR